MGILSGLYDPATFNQVRPLPPVQQASFPQAPMIMEGGGLQPPTLQAVEPPTLQRVPFEYSVPRTGTQMIGDEVQKYMAGLPKQQQPMAPKMTLGDRLRSLRERHGSMDFTPTPDMFGKGVDSERRPEQNYLPGARFRYRQ